MSKPEIPEPQGSSDAERQRARWEAADILSWGGPPPQQEPGQLPSHWTDVTDIVLSALAEVRAKEERRKNINPDSEHN